MGNFKPNGPNITKSSADADKPARRVWSVKVTKHIVPFRMLGILSY